MKGQAIREKRGATVLSPTENHVIYVVQARKRIIELGIFELILTIPEN